MPSRTSTPDATAVPSAAAPINCSVTYFWDGIGDTRVTIHIDGPAQAGIDVQLKHEPNQSATIDIPSGVNDQEHGFATHEAPTAVLVNVIKDANTVDCPVTAQ